MKWQANQYLSFEKERTQPIADLINAIPNNSFSEIIDLGCGTGSAIPLLKSNFAADIIGIDSSANMIEKAKKHHPNGNFTVCDIVLWLEKQPISNKSKLLFSNAALHWLDHHQTLLTSLLKHTGKNGCLAVQMPNNWSEPSHQHILTMAKHPNWNKYLKHMIRPKPVLSKNEYQSILTPICDEVKVWNKTYTHMLKGEEPVLSWLLGTSLKYYLDALPAETHEDFLAQLAPMLNDSYPTNKDGVTSFNFNRLFIVAKPKASF